MRTAEEYAGIYWHSQKKMEAIQKIIGMFMRETGLEINKVAARSSEIPIEETRDILKRQSEKWRKFAELVEVAHPEGYERMLQLRYPMFFSILNDGVLPPGS